VAAQKRFADAEPLLISGYEGMATRKPDNPNAVSRFGVEEAGAAIVTLYADWGNGVKPPSGKRGCGGDRPSMTPLRNPGNLGRRQAGLRRFRAR
jgi:hypothetical protein